MQDQTDTGTASSDIAWAEPRTSAADFNMINETTQDANNLERSLLYLQQSDTATDIINQASGASITFDHADVNADQAFQDGSGVGWNPEVALQLSTGEVMSPALNLASEFAHMVLPGGLDPNATPDPVWDNSAEAVAHQAANVMAGELNEPQRAGYADGDFLLLTDPTVSFKSESGILSGDATGAAAPDHAQTGSFDAGSFAADYGVADYGYDSGLGSYGAGSFGSYDGSGFDAGAFGSDYGIGDFGGGGSGGGFSDDGYFANVAFV